MTLVAEIKIISKDRNNVLLLNYFCNVVLNHGAL